MKSSITINSRKFDGRVHRSWKCSLIERRDSLLVFVGTFEKEINHPELGVINRGTTSYEYYWLNRWFNIFRFHEPNGDLRNFYCNVNMPPTFLDNVLDYIDLDIDIVIWKDFSLKVLDCNEFEENSKVFNYSDELKVKVKDTLDELLSMINLRQFPFDFK